VIAVRFNEPEEMTAWIDWRKKAAKATEALREKFSAGEPYRIQGALYKTMRQVYLDAFDGKCAYCEAKLILDQHHGDVEHYRPKGKVTDATHATVMITGPGGEAKPHPGYPWLAYDWRNLLPSCIACNRPFTTRVGRKVGKWERFPVAGFRASSPDAEKQEEPLLLHPLLDEPGTHLAFDTATGILCPKTVRGSVTIEILDLNREGLPEARWAEYQKAQGLAYAALHDNDVDRVRARITLLEAYRKGSAEYSLAGRAGLDDFARS
jgi:hypothetical protein